MKTFRIGYKMFYRETSEHHSDYIQAESERAALKIFAKEHKIPMASRQQPEKWQWWDGEWLYEFRAVELVNVIPCPHCGRKGEIATATATMAK
jgi:hypothetical protein